MLGRRADPDNGGATGQGQGLAFDHGSRRQRHAGAGALSPPPTLFVVTGDGEEALASPEHADAITSSTSTLQAAASISSPTCPAMTACRSATGAVPFSRRHGVSSSSGGGDRRSRRIHRPWDTRPVGLGLAGALNGDVGVAPSVVATTAVLVTGGRHMLRPVKAASVPRPPSPELGVKSTGGEEEEFLRWCHGCSKDLGEGKDIFMYRGEMAFCSHDCRYREMLLDEEL